MKLRWKKKRKVVPKWHSSKNCPRASLLTARRGELHTLRGPLSADLQKAEVCELRAPSSRSPSLLWPARKPEPTSGLVFEFQPCVEFAADACCDRASTSNLKLLLHPSSSSYIEQPQALPTSVPSTSPSLNGGF